jgi:hypothetical protein
LRLKAFFRRGTDAFVISHKPNPSEATSGGQGRKICFTAHLLTKRLGSSHENF